MKNDKLPMLEIPPVVSAKTENQMKSESQWLSTDFAREMIHGMPITVKDKNVGEIEGHLKVEKANSEGQMVVSAHYDSSPFPDEARPAKFYLTQEQFDDFVRKGKPCVLNVPAKN